METNQCGFDPARVEDFPDVNENDKSVDLIADTQGVHCKQECHNASVDQVLEDFESTRGERCGTTRVEESGSLSRLRRSDSARIQTSAQLLSAQETLG